MAHLLVLENWVFGTGHLLPKKIRALGHKFTFVTRNKSHYCDDRTNKIHPIFELADHILTCETNDPDILIPFLQKQHEVLKFDGILTVCDYYVDAISAVAKALDLPQAFSSNVAQVRKKHRVRQLIDDANLPNCKYEVAYSWEETLSAAKQLGYPLVMKPSDLASSALVSLINNESELKQAFSDIDEMKVNFREQWREPLWLLEEYMAGEEYSVEACTFRGETTILGITDKSITGEPFFIENGHMFPADIEESQAKQITDLVLKTLQAVGHDHGLSHTEVKLTPEGPKIVEINSRPGGNYIAELMEIVTGFDVLKAHIELALNIKPDVETKITQCQSAAVQFYVPHQTGIIQQVNGISQLEQHDKVHRFQFEDLVGKTVEPAIDNATYLGHVITFDNSGKGARKIAEQLINQLSVEVE